MTIKNGRVSVRVFNPLNKPLKIYRSSSIGELYPLHGGEELSEEENVGINYKIVSSGVSESDVGVLPEVKQCGAVQLEDFENCCVSMEELFPINSDAVLEEEKHRHYKVLATYANCISRGPMDLGRAKGVKHTIDTGSAEPIQVPPRRVPFHKREEIRRQVDEMLEAGIIEPSESSWSSSCGADSKTRWHATFLCRLPCPELGNEAGLVSICIHTGR